MLRHQVTLKKKNVISGHKKRLYTFSLLNSQVDWGVLCPNMMKAAIISMTGGKNSKKKYCRASNLT